MIVDASAVLAILLSEPDQGKFADRLTMATDRLRMSPVNYLEVITKVLRTKNDLLMTETDNLFDALDIELASVTREQARLAREAYVRFGKGRHPARLNIGDCFAYALSKARDEPLLYKGSDFSQTDVEAAF